MTIKQKVILNSVLIIGTYFVPLYILNQNQDSYSNIETIQKFVFYILFLGAVILTYLNYKNISKLENLKWLWILFEVIGVLGVVYSAVVLYLIFAFRHGIGF